MTDIFLLFPVQAANTIQPEHFGEPRYAGQRRAQFIGDMLDELVLQMIGLFQRFIALFQRPLDIDRSGRIRDRHHGLCFRQPNQAVIQYCAIPGFDPALQITPVIVIGGYPFMDVFPQCGVGKPCLAGL